MHFIKDTFTLSFPENLFFFLVAGNIWEPLENLKLF